MAQAPPKIRIDKVSDSSGYIYLIEGKERRVVTWTAERVFPPRNSSAPVTQTDLLAARRELKRCGLLSPLESSRDATTPAFASASAEQQVTCGARARCSRPATERNRMTTSERRTPRSLRWTICPDGE